MTAREYYIRYRIYVNYSERANKDYPKRLRENLYNLHRNIKEAPKLTFQTGEIKHKIFIPKNLQHVGPKYYQLISYIAEYFECLALWETTMVKGTTQHLNTFSIWGYEPDILLVYHYITKIINSLNAMRYNIKQDYRAKRIKRKQKGLKPYGKGTATTKSSKFFYKSLLDICVVCKEILEDTPVSPNKQEKLNSIWEEIDKRKSLNYRDYKYTSGLGLRHARSVIGKFQNKRLILVNF